MTFVRLYSVVVSLPNSITISETLFEISFEGTAVFPDVLAWALGKTVYKLSFVEIFIAVPLFALTVFETIFEWAYVHISI